MVTKRCDNVLDIVERTYKCLDILRFVMWCKHLMNILYTLLDMPS